VIPAAAARRAQLHITEAVATSSSNRAIETAPDTA
jgi:hypothetical protein